jgi:MFS family permease
LVPITDPKTSLWRVHGVRPLVVITVLGFTGFAATLASLPWWAVQGGASQSAAGLVTTVMLAVTVATQFSVPAVVRRVGVGRTLAAGLLLLGAPSPLYVLSHDLLPMVAVSAVRGIGFGVLTVVGSTLTAMLAPPGRHGELVGLYGLAIAVPNLLVVPGGVALAQNVGFWPVAILATLPVLAAPLALAEGNERPTQRSEPSGGRQAYVASLAPSVVLLAVTFAGGGVLTFVPIERPDGFVATATLTLMSASAGLCRWRVGALADRVGTRVLLPVSVLIGVVGLALVAAGLGWSSSALLLVGGAVFGISYGAVQNLTLVIAVARVGRESAATASAVWNAAFDTGTAIGAVVVGALAGLGTGVAGALLVATLVLGLTAPFGRTITGARRGSAAAGEPDVSLRGGAA